MAKHVVDFRTPGTVTNDTGEPEKDAIRPHQNGEPAREVVFQRPVENNRGRSDVLRDKVRELAMVADFDRGMALLGGGTITFSGSNPGDSGTIVTTSDLFVVPFNTPGGGGSAPYVDSTKASLSIGVLGTNQITFTSLQDQYEGSTFPASDANKISVEIVDGGAAPTTVAVNGATGEVDNILITIDGATPPTCLTVVNAVNGHGTANTLVLASVPVPDDAGPCPLFSETQWAGDLEARFLKGGAPGLAHRITPGVLSAFFGTAANQLQKGDTLAIWYDKLLDTTSTGGRLQSTPENTNIDILVGGLFNTRTEPEKVPNCIPIAKCIDDNNVIFIDDTRIKKAVGGSLGNSSIDITGWTRMHAAPGAHVPPSTAQQALNNADDLFETIFGTTVVCTDGTTTTGGNYDGVNAIDLAIAALLSVDGGRILVRAGTYDIAATPTIDKKIEIIGVESGVTIQNANAGADAFFMTAEGCKLRNFTLTQGGGAAPTVIGVTGGGFILEDVISSAGQIDIAGDRAKIINSVLGAPAGAGYVLSGSGSHVSVENCEITGAAKAAYLHKGTHWTFDNCAFYLDGAADGITDLAVTDTDLVFRNCHFLCSPFTGTFRAIKLILGQRYLFENCRITMSAASDIVTTIMEIGGVTSQNHKIIGLTADLGLNLLQFGQGNNPFRFLGNTHVRSFHLTRVKLPRGAGTLDKRYPIVQLTADGTAPVYGNIVVVEDSLIDGFDFAAGTGDMNCTVIGDEGDNNADAVNVNGRFELLNTVIDGNGKTIEDGVSRMVAHMPPGSVVKDCSLLGGTLGRWNNCVRNGAASKDLVINDNLLECDRASGFENPIYLGGGASGPENCHVNRNKILFNDLRAVSNRAILLAGQATPNFGFHCVVNDNIVENRASGGFAMASLINLSNMRYSTAIGNTTKTGAATKGVEFTGDLAGNVPSGGVALTDVNATQP